MKLLFILMTTCLMQVSALTYAQRITLSEKNATLISVFEKISKQSGVDFLVTNELLAGTKNINIQVKDKALTEVLDRIFEGQPLSYTVKDQAVIVKRKEPSFLDRANLVILNAVKNLIQNLDVRGVIRDEQGNPMPNATIVVKGKSQVYRSNEKGEFTIENVADDAVLLISYVGYKTLEISLKDAVIPLEIKLNQLTGELEEVKIEYSTGYQNIPKERATGSFIQLSNETINRTISKNVLDRIKELTNSLTVPAAKLGSSDITIRGISTINASMKPLIVIDGFPYEEGNGRAGQINLENLNPNDVEHITILRDAAAASIWGARSGNGVIVITTKKGSFNEKTRIEINGNLNVIDKPDLSKYNIISSADAIEFEKKLFANGLFNSYNGPFSASYSYPVVSPAIEIMLAEKRGELSIIEANDKLEILKGHDVRSDVEKYLLQKSLNQQYHLSVKGGGDKANYYSSIGYDKNLLSSKGNQDGRLTLRIDNSYRPIPNLEVNSYIVFTNGITKNNGLVYQNYIATGIGNTIAPYTMLANINGDPLHISKPDGGALRTAYIDTISFRGLLDWHYRPLEEVKNSENNGRLIDVRLGGGLNYKISKGLHIELKGQYLKALTNIDNYYSVYSYVARNLINRYMFINSLNQPQYPVPLGGILEYSDQKQSHYNLRGQINLNRNWNANHVSAVFGTEIRETKFESITSRKYGYDPVTLTYTPTMDHLSRYTTRPSGNNSIIDGGNLQSTLDRFLSYYSNIAYTLLDKYTLTGSARIDASNFFGINANLKMIPLWSTGVSWNVLKENFWRQTNISTLKIRATYGFNGNLSNIATSLPTISYFAGFSPYNNSQQFASLRTPPNPGLTWEKIKMLNTGIDFGFFHNRLSGSLEFYKKKGINLIGSLNIEQTVGTDTYTGNYASIAGKGLDLIVNYESKGTTSKWSSAFSFSYNTDKVSDYELPFTFSDNGSSYLGGAPIPGKPRYSFYSYRWAGLSGATGDPLGIINDQIVPFTAVLQSAKAEDMIYNGQFNPKFFGNLLNTISYKSISATFNITYRFGFYFRRPSINYNDLRSRWGGHGDYANRWQKPGDEILTNVPSMPASTDQRYQFYSNSEILVEKGDHIRFNDFRLSYNVNRNITSKFHVASIALFAYVNNIGILWRANHSKLDPLSINQPAPPRSIAFGLKINH